MTNVDEARLAQFNELRPLLFSAAYRMLGSRMDAEDILQDAFLKWQDCDTASVQSPRAYLLTIVSRLALDQLKSARAKRETYIGPWLPEPIVQNAPDPVELAESLSIAFLHVLESLAPAERVAFLLREVFGEDYNGIAATLATSEANARQLVTRARKHVQEKRPRFAVDRERHREILETFVKACAYGSVTDLVGLLKEDAVFYSDGGGRVSAALNPIYGADRIVRFVLGVRQKFPLPLGGYFAMINGEPGFVSTLDGGIYSTATIEIAEDGRISRVFFVMNPEKLPH